MFIEINQNLKNIKVRLIFIFLKDVSTLLFCEVTKKMNTNNKLNFKQEQKNWSVSRLEFIMKITMNDERWNKNKRNTVPAEMLRSPTVLSSEGC